MSEIFTADNGREFEVSEHGFVSGTVDIDVNELIEHNLDGALELFAERLVGNALLSDISYSAVAVSNGQIVMHIAGDIQNILDARSEAGESPSLSP